MTGKEAWMKFSSPCSLELGKSGHLIGFVLVGDEVDGIGRYPLHFVQGIALLVQFDLIDITLFWG